MEEGAYEIEGQGSNRMGCFYLWGLARPQTQRPSATTTSKSSGQGGGIGEGGGVETVCRVDLFRTYTLER